VEPIGPEKSVIRIFDIEINGKPQDPDSCAGVVKNGLISPGISSGDGTEGEKAIPSAECVQIVEIVEISSKLNLGASIVVLLAQFHCLFASRGNTCSSSRSLIIVALVRLPFLCPITSLEFIVRCKIVSFGACVKE
jgi:hypothetical protein